MRPDRSAEGTQELPKPTCVLSVLCHATYIDPDTYNTVIVHVGRDDDRREERQEGTTDD